jgi:hypothetical protein
LVGSAIINGGTNTVPPLGLSILFFKKKKRKKHWFRHRKWRNQCQYLNGPFRFSFKKLSGTDRAAILGRFWGDFGRF